MNRYRKENNIPDEELLGVGIGVPGAVVKGVVNRCVNLGWGVVPIEEELSKGTGLSVKASNDANVAALGEYWVGGGQGSENVIFITLEPVSAAASSWTVSCLTAPMEPAASWAIWS